MQLEDHLGDVLAKARAGKSVGTAEAAGAAGLTPEQYSELERQGRVAARPNYAALATLLGLQADRLEGLAQGWLPQERDLSAWRELRQVVTAHGGMSVNAYLVWDEVTREAALFDTGFDAAPVLALIDEQKLMLRHVFITHAHPDHILALPAVKDRFPKVRLHASAASTPVEQRNRPNDFLHLGNLRISNRATPGHADDGVTYVVGSWPEDAPNVAMVGDALFAGSMGGAGSRLEEARTRVREQIFSLPADTLICPGHGPVTTVGEERVHNPFF